MLTLCCELGHVEEEAPGEGAADRVRVPAGLQSHSAVVTQAHQLLPHLYSLLVPEHDVVSSYIGCKLKVAQVEKLFLAPGRGARTRLHSPVSKVR